MMKFIHLTDTHLVPPGRRLYGLDPLARLTAAIRDLNQQQPDAAFAIITGDLTHYGQRAAYEALQEALAELSMPYHLVVGNHDRRDEFVEVFTNTPRDSNGFIQYVFDTSQFRCIVLDTLDHDTHAGVLCPQRLTWLTEQLTLAQREAKPVWLFMHHPPFDVGLTLLDSFGLVQKQALGDTIAPFRSQINYLVFGHVHRPVHGTWQGIPFHTLRGLNHQVWFESANIVGSHEPPAYAVISVEAAQVTIHVHDFLDNSPKFSLLDPAAIEAVDIATLPRVIAGSVTVS